MTASEWNSTDHHRSILCVKAEEQFIEYWAIARKGLTILFQSGKCKVFHPKRGLIKEMKMSSNRMFILHAISQPIAFTCFNTIIHYKKNGKQ